MPVGHEVVALVAEHAHDLGGERLVEDLDDLRSRSAPYDEVIGPSSIFARRVRGAS